MKAEEVIEYYKNLTDKERVKFGIMMRKFDTEEHKKSTDVKKKLFDELSNIKDNKGNNFFSEEYLKNRLK